MKLGPRGLTFLWPAWTLFRRHIAFVGRDNTIHIQETALVIEGDRVCYRLPILDLFVKRGLAERSMVTVPYSRLVGLDHPKYIAVKIIWWILALGLFALVATPFLNSRDPEDAVYFLPLIGALFLCISYLVHRFFRPRYALVFREDDGGECVICFWPASRKRRREFVQTLRGNCEAARTLAAPGAETTHR